MQTRRSAYEVRMMILRAVAKGITVPTHIMLATNTSSAILRSNLKYLLDNHFIELIPYEVKAKRPYDYEKMQPAPQVSSRKRYKITDAGRELSDNYFRAYNKIAGKEASQRELWLAVGHSYESRYHS